jgi:hypothetical protein
MTPTIQLGMSIVTRAEARPPLVVFEALYDLSCVSRCALLTPTQLTLRPQRNAK